MRALAIMSLAVAVVVSAGAQETDDMVAMPRTAIERMVQENIELRSNIEAAIEQMQKMQQHIRKLQAATNCV